MNSETKELKVQEPYVYKPQETVVEYDAGVAILRSTHPKVKAGWVDPNPYLEEIWQGIRKVGLLQKEI